jgi:hypothetical protein
MDGRFLSVLVLLGWTDLGFLKGAVTTRMHGWRIALRTGLIRMDEWRISPLEWADGGFLH